MNKKDFPKIILCGKKQSGKDDFSKMLQYLIENNFFECAPLSPTFDYNSYHNSKLTEFSNSVKLAFADSLKNVLSSILLIDKNKFENEHFKNNTFINLRTFELYYSIDSIPTNAINDVLSLRELLQNTTAYLSPLFGNDIWVKSLAAKIKLESNKKIIISDLRRDIEYNYARSINNAIIVKIERYMPFEAWLSSLSLDNNIITEIKNIIQEKNMAIKIGNINSNEFLYTLKKIAPFIISEKTTIMINKIINTLTDATETNLDTFDYDYLIENNKTLEELFEEAKKFLIKINSNE